MTFTLVVFLLTVMVGPNNVPISMVRTAQQTLGYPTGDACAADAAAKQVAKMPGVVFWMCMATASGADQWLVQNWLRTPTTELPVLQSAVPQAPTWFMVLTLSYPVPILVRMGGFPSLEACTAVRQQLNFAPVDAVQATVSACQSTVVVTPPPPPPVVTAGGQDVLVWTACPPQHVTGFLRVSSCRPECDPGYHNSVQVMLSTPCPPLAP